MSLYEILGVPRDASHANIKAARNQLALECHPDRVPDESAVATARLQTINAAYEVLADEGRRRRYDAQLAARRQPGFEFSCADVKVISTMNELRCTHGDRTVAIPLDTVTRLLIRRRPFAPRTATLLIRTSRGRHRLRLPTAAAEALAAAIARQALAC